MTRMLDRHEFNGLFFYFKPISQEFMEEVLWLATTKKGPLLKRAWALQELCFKHAEVTETVRGLHNVSCHKDVKLYRCPLCSKAYRESRRENHAWRSSVCDEIEEGLSKLPCRSDIDKTLSHIEYREEEFRRNRLRREFLDKYSKHFINANLHGFTEEQLKSHYCERQTPSNFCRPFKLLTKYFMRGKV